MIQNQVKLPLNIALEVVLQGLKIRLGRSVVTLTGVVCGIAFLMSILTGQVIKKGVSQEDDTRSEVERMLNFLRADLPPLRGKTVGLIHAGASLETEQRLLKTLQQQDGATLALIAGKPKAEEGHFQQGLNGKETSVYIVVGQGELPDFAWETIGPNKPVAITGPHAISSLQSSQLTNLQRKKTAEELEKEKLTKAQDKFRNLWIAIISLLVTVIGITNAMLMSVTERFREIGTMKCLGALSAFIRQIFLIESSMMGLAGGIIGALIGALFSTCAYAFTYGFGLVFSSMDLLSVTLYAALSVITGVILSILAAIYPAQVASKMVPAHALRSNV